MDSDRKPPQLPPEVDRALRARFAAGPMTADSLRDIDDAHQAAYDQQDKINKQVRRVRMIAGFLISLLCGYIIDRIALALGMPEEWLLRNMLLNIWNAIF